MSKHILLCLSVCLLVVGVAAVVTADVPSLIHYQGILLDASGSPLEDEEFNFRFTIYDGSATPPAVIKWGPETHITVPTNDNALFSVFLGSIIGITDDVFEDTIRWLQIEIDDAGNWETIFPRIQLVTVPYAFRVATVDSASGGTIKGDVEIKDGKLGVGIASPVYKLDVAGTAQMTGFKMLPGANPDYVLTSDAAGVGTWLPAAAGADNDWTLGTPPNDDVLFTIGPWGIARDGNILHGTNDYTHVNLGVLSTTGTSGQNWPWATVGGGYQNTASTPASTVGGGYLNTSSGNVGTVGGGFTNTASGDESTVGGGGNNSASGNASTVGGGDGNTANGRSSTVGGGDGNTANGRYSTVGGGRDNSVSADSATVGGGSHNLANGLASTVGGGRSNTASGHVSTVGGGLGNTASSLYSTVPGGSGNLAAGNYSFAAGQQAQANHHGTFVWSDNIAGIFASSAVNQFLIRASGGVGIGTTSPAEQLDVAGTAQMTGFKMPTGASNTYVLTSDAAGVGTWLPAAAGVDNDWVLVGGDVLFTIGPWGIARDGNILHGTNDYTHVNLGVLSTTGTSGQNFPYATVGGGYQNTASAAGGTVGGGYQNTASGSYSTVGGGLENAVSGFYGIVGGGAYNRNAGTGSVIPGGTYDTLTVLADISMAFGTGVYVDNPYRVVFFDDTVSGRLGLNRDDRSGGINYPIHVGNKTSNGNGAHLTEGGVWTDGSSRDFKENFQALDSKELLEKVSSIPVTAWNYKNSDERHIGPMAEDFVAAFDVGTIREDDGRRENRYLAARDVAGVALIGVKELAKQNQELRERIDQLEALVEAILAQQDGSNQPKAQFGMSK